MDVTTMTPDPDFGPVDPGLLDLLRKTAAPRQVVDWEDNDPTNPQSVAWWRAKNRAYAAEHIPRRYTQATTTRRYVHEWVYSVATDPENTSSLLLLGPTGTGKTHIAYAALRLLCETPRRTDWKAISAAALLGDLRPAPGRDTEAVLASYTSASLLLLDDLGAAKSSEWVEEVLYRLIDARYNACLPSIFATNVSTPDELTGRLGERTASRLVEMCRGHLITLKGADRRLAAA
jgi:DNA replication protein DnaC